MKDIDLACSLPDKSAIILAVGKMISKKIKKRDHFDHLTEPEKVFVYIDVLEAALNEGGFTHFFSHSSGAFAHEILHAYEQIGAENTADILYRAITLFPTLPVPKDLASRQAILETMPDRIIDQWDQLGEDCYRFREEVAALLIRFIIRNKSAFG